MSIANYGENALLDSLPDPLYAKLHTGDPGENCASNAATETTRATVSLGAASSGTRTSDTDITWTAVSASEAYSHISLWDASSGGNAYWYGALNAPVSITSGNTFVIASGQLTVSLD